MKQAIDVNAVLRQVKPTQNYRDDLSILSGFLSGLLLAEESGVQISGIHDIHVAVFNLVESARDKAFKSKK